jgi:secondary thiamine-phosphate synthase enzyme
MNLRIDTKDKRQVVDITDDVQTTLKDTDNGVTVISVQHTTCALTTADLDPGTDQDFLDFLNTLVPDIKWRHPHDPGHTPSHLLSSLIGPSVTVPIEGGKLKLGSWQRIILVEFDGPRKRKLTLNLLKSS